MKYIFILIFTILNGIIFSQNQLIFQPNSNNGKDATIWKINNKNTKHGYVDIKNFGNNKDFKAIVWTFQFCKGEKRGLLEFNLKKLPKNIYIKSALLSLYANAESEETDNLKYPLDRNFNECILQRIIEPWDENNVTWKTQPMVTKKNQVILHKSEKYLEDYKDIDVTNLVRDMVQYPDSNFGFMISIKEKKPYSSLIFASSDHPNPKKHPKLVIDFAYTKNGFFKRNKNKIVIVIYDETGTEIKRFRNGKYRKPDLKAGVYTFNIIKNKVAISSGKFIVY